MLYRNISGNPVWILQSRVKTLVGPGETVNLNTPDINHSGSSMRFFESLAKHQVVKVNEWDKATLVEAAIEIPEPVIAVEEIKIEEVKKEIKVEEPKEIKVASETFETLGLDKVIPEKVSTVKPARKEKLKEAVDNVD